MSVRSERVGGYALIGWNDSFFHWVSISVSEQRERLVCLRDRLRMAHPFEMRIIEAASIEDDDVEAVGAVEPWPDHVAHLHHEAHGIE